jgi:hypothetical protein
MEEYSLEIEGAWIRICCKLWWSESKGKLSKTLKQWSRILRVDEVDAKRILDVIKVENIGDVTERNKKITVENRRMYRDFKEKEANRLRQEKYRQKHESNGDITSYSSSSTSSSFSRDNQEISGKPQSGIKDKDVQDMKLDVIVDKVDKLLDRKCSYPEAGKILKEAGGDWTAFGDSIVAIEKCQDQLKSDEYIGLIKYQLKTRSKWSDDDHARSKIYSNHLDKKIQQKFGVKLGKVL